MASTNAGALWVLVMLKMFGHQGTHATDSQTLAQADRPSPTATQHQPARGQTARDAVGGAPDWKPKILLAHRKHPVAADAPRPN